MEKYSLSLRKGRLTLSNDRKTDCVCNRGEIGCQRLNFKNTGALYDFLQKRISSFDEFEVNQKGIFITWHEKNDETHLVRSARIEFSPDLSPLIMDDINNIQSQYRKHREATDTLKARCREELQKSNLLNDNPVLSSYCDFIIKVYSFCGKTETLYDEADNKKFLDFLTAYCDNFIQKEEEKVREEEKNSRDQSRKICLLIGCTIGGLAVVLIPSLLCLAVSIPGEVLVSGFYLYQREKKYDKKMEQCKKKASEYQSFTENLKVSMTSTKSHQLFDKKEFLNFINQDVDFMNAHSCEDYTDLHAQIEKLRMSYTKEILEGQTIDINKYLLALAYIEIDIYSKETGIGLKSECDCPICGETILRRLNLMGIDKFIDYTQDAHLTTLLESVDRILKTPFIGCEAELARLNRIAIDYVQEVLKHGRQDEEFDANKIDDIIREGQNENSTIADRLQNAERYQYLCNLLDDMSAHLTVDPNMNIDKGFTLPQ